MNLLKGLKALRDLRGGWRLDGLQSTVSMPSVPTLTAPSSNVLKTQAHLLGRVRSPYPGVLERERCTPTARQTAVCVCLCRLFACLGWFWGPWHCPFRSILLFTIVTIVALWFPFWPWTWTIRFWLSLTLCRFFALNSFDFQSSIGLRAKDFTRIVRCLWPWRGFLGTPKCASYSGWHLA